MILQVRKRLSIPVSCVLILILIGINDFFKIHVIIRPRGGDFCYSDEELEVCKHDIELCKKFGVNGVVLGLLTPDGNVDMIRTKELVDLARPLSVTFHRAVTILFSSSIYNFLFDKKKFDMTRDPFRAMEDVISLGIERILTSGQESSCLEGLELLTELVARAKDRIVIMPGGGITEKNVKKILETCKATEFHVSGRVTQDSLMQFRNTRCFMGGVLRPPEFSLSIVSSEKISNFLKNSSRQ